MTKKVKQASAQRNKRKTLKEIRKIAVVVVLLGVATAGLAMYKRSYDIAHNLSDIGNGIPTIVQIHDPDCSLCKNLRDNVNVAKSDFGDQLQFRIADISTNKGRGFANRYDVPHVTLLLFDAKGDLKTILSGVQQPDKLRASFKALL